VWQHIRKSHRITTKVVAADKRLLTAFKAALVFIPFIVMLVVASLNITSVVVVAVDVATDLRWCLRWCKK
jgi:hypothetical protein